MSGASVIEFKVAKAESTRESKSPPKVAALRPAVFFDRDGTIAEEMGYLNHISRLRMFPNAGRAISRLNRANVPVFVVTNQSGVSRGIFPETLIAEVHRRVAQNLSRSDAHVDGFYYCSHTSADKCDCRKPLPGLLLRAAKEHGLDLSRSFVVGDRYGDIELAQAAGGQGILVLTGYGRGEFELHHQEWPRQPDAVLGDIAEAAEFILERLSSVTSIGKRPAAKPAARKRTATAAQKPKTRKSKAAGRKPRRKVRA